MEKEFIGNSDMTYDDFMTILENWINEGKLKKYMEDKYEKWLLFHHGSYAELFISEEEEFKDYEVLFYIVDEVLIKSGLDIDGEGTIFVTDRVMESTLKMGYINDATSFSGLCLEFDNDGEPLYMDGDIKTKKEFIRSVK